MVCLSVLRFWKSDSMINLFFMYRLTIELSEYCTPPFFLLGQTCSKFCQERDDQFGHYTCTGNGDKECRAGK